jgi:hypothetical protein
MMLLALILALAAAAPGGAAERWDALQALPRVAVEITFSPNHPDLSTAEVRPHVEEALRRASPAPAIDPASADRLRLIIAVRSFTTSDLRGFYLPLSQAYGIGPVRLVVERPAAVSGLPAPIWATVWQAERQATGPWRQSAGEILKLVDELMGSFLGDYRRALGQ